MKKRLQYCGLTLERRRERGLDRNIQNNDWEDYVTHEWFLTMAVSEVTNVNSARKGWGQINKHFSVRVATYGWNSLDEKTVTVETINGL